MRILAEAGASIEEKERAFAKWLDEHPDATLAPSSAHDMAQDEYDLQVVMGLRGMIGPSLPVYWDLASALRRARLLDPNEEIEAIQSILRYPGENEIRIMVKRSR